MASRAGRARAAALRCTTVGSTWPRSSVDDILRTALPTSAVAAPGLRGGVAASGTGDGSGLERPTTVVLDAVCVCTPCQIKYPHPSSGREETERERDGVGACYVRLLFVSARSADTSREPLRRILDGGDVDRPSTRVLAAGTPLLLLLWLLLLFFFFFSGDGSCGDARADLVSSVDCLLLIMGPGS